VQKTRYFSLVRRPAYVSLRQADRDSTPGAAENLPLATFQTSLLHRVPARSNPII